MKTVYVCEKCGANYDNYDAAYQCEESHLDLYVGSDYAPELRGKSVWKNSSVLPTSCVLPSMEKYVEDPDTGEWHYVTVFGVYELKRLLKDDEVAKIENEHEMRKQKEHEEYERWSEEYRKSKAAKEAAEKAAAEAEAANGDEDTEETAESA